MNSLKSLGSKITVLLTVTLVIGFATLISTGINSAKAIHADNLKSRLSLLSDSFITSIQEMMLTGNALIVLDWIKGIKKMEGAESIQILRLNGDEGFSDNSTIASVNQYLGGGETFKPHSGVQFKADSEFEGFNVEHTSKKKMAEVEKTGGEIFYTEELNGKHVLTILKPLKHAEECRTCHGYDKNRFRAIVRISMSTEKMEDDISDEKFRLIAVSLATLLAVLAILQLLLRRVMIIPIKLIKDGVEKTADGDLTTSIDVDSNDELGHLSTDFNSMVDSLNDKSLQIKQHTNTLKTSTEMVEGFAHDLSIEIKKQLVQTEQIATSSEELSRSVNEVKGSGQTASESSQDVLKAAKEGKQEIEQAINEVRIIEQSAKESDKLIHTLAERSEEIGTVIGVINDIADQTNLLALNAAIEAARAGEQGRGFAIVAEEVRKLAERTMGATRNISSTIENIQIDTNNAINQIKTVTVQTSAGLKLSEQAGNTYLEIIGKIETTARMISAIAQAMEEQSDVAEDIASKISGVSAIATDTSENAELAAAGIKEMQNNLDKIFEQIAHFKLKE